MRSSTLLLLAHLTSCLLCSCREGATTGSKVGSSQEGPKLSANQYLIETVDWDDESRTFETPTKGTVQDLGEGLVIIRAALTMIEDPVCTRIADSFRENHLRPVRLLVQPKGAEIFISALTEKGECIIVCKNSDDATKVLQALKIGKTLRRIPNEPARE